MYSVLLVKQLEITVEEFGHWLACTTIISAIVFGLLLGLIDLIWILIENNRKAINRKFRKMIRQAHKLTFIRLD